MTDDDPALAATTASGGDSDKPEASRDTLPAGDLAPTSARPASRLALVDRERYAVSGEMARGGLGRILRARDRHLGRSVALKEMLRGGAEAERRFVREALITARLEHPSIVPVHDAGRGEDGAPFYAMKLVGGRALSDVYASATTTSERLALVPRILAVADAIAYAHSQRVIHRDLKPANVLCGEFGETVVIDWGLAKDLDASADEDVSTADTEAAGMPRLSASHTIGGAILGTPAYMAPEQAAGAEVDERADVYALGAMLYELLSGAPPHRGDTLDDVLRRVISGDLEPLHARAPDVPADLAAIVAKAMAREPGGRYPSARELADDLRRYVTGQLVAVYRYGRLEKIARWVGRNRAAVAVALIATAILGVVGVVAIGRIVDERDQAREARAVAERAEQAARERGDDVLIEQARAEVAQDPTRAVAILAGLGPTSARWSAARVVAADARERGIANVLVGHIWATEAIAFDRDGNRVASLGHDGIRVWDRTARTVRFLPLPDPCGVQRDCTFGSWTLALSGDGRWLAAGAGAVTRWDLSDLDRWDLAGAGFAAAPPVPGTLVEIGDDGELVLATAADPRPEVVSLSGATTAWTSPLSADRVTLHVRSGTGEKTFEIPTPHHVAIARDDNTILWNDAQGLAWLSLSPPDLRRGAAPSGTITELIAGPTADEMIIATDSAVVVAHIDGHREVLMASHRPGHLVTSRNGRALAVTGTATVPVWTIESDPGAMARAPRDPQSPSAAAGFDAHTAAEMATSGDGTVLVIDWMTGPVELWFRNGGSLEKSKKLPIPAFSDLSVAPDGRQILYVDDDGAALLPTLRSEARRLGPAQLGWFSPDGVAHTIDESGAIHRWNADGTSAIACPDTLEWGELKASADGSTVGGVVKGQLRRCRLATSGVETTDGAGNLAPWSLRADGASAAGFDKTAGQLVVLDAGGRHEVSVSTAPAAVLLSPDGRWVVAVAAEGGFTIVDVAAKTARPVVVAGRMPGDATFLPGDTVAVIGESGIVVADLMTGAARTLQTPAPPSSVGAYADAALLAVVGARVMVWLDDLPHEPAALRAWIEAATDARIAPTGELTTAAPFRGP